MHEGYMFDEIRELTGKRKSCPQSGCIRAKDGSMLTDRNDILIRWAEHIIEMFEDSRKDKPVKNIKQWKAQRFERKKFELQ